VNQIHLLREEESRPEKGKSHVGRSDTHAEDTFREGRRWGEKGGGKNPRSKRKKRVERKLEKGLDHRQEIAISDENGAVESIAKVKERRKTFEVRSQTRNKERRARKSSLRKKESLWG